MYVIFLLQARESLGVTKSSDDMDCGKFRSLAWQGIITCATVSKGLSISLNFTGGGN